VVLGTLLWIVIAAACTALLVLLRESLDKAHAALVYVLIVLGASAHVGRIAGFTLALTCFLAFNFFLLPPYHTFALADPLDWFVLAAMLVVSGVAAELLHRARLAASTARLRAAEVDRLSRLGAETLSVGPSEEAVRAVARVIQAELPIAHCDVLRRVPAPMRFQQITARGTDEDLDSQTLDLLEYVAEQGVVAIERTDGTTHLLERGAELSQVLKPATEAHAALIPLVVRDQPLGVLRLVGSPQVVLDPAQTQFAEALAHYAALGLERVRLSAEAEQTAALRETDRLKDALLANVSHDLRTPLTTIKALAHDIRADGGGSATERAATIEEEADRLNRMVADLLDLSRISTGTLSFRPEINAADDLVGAALARLSGLPGAAAIEVDLGAEAGVLLGRFDFLHALRSLVNLLDNALKFSGGELVSLVVRRAGDRLLFEVHDRGPGVAPADAERIFEPFYRAPGAERAGGTGLGLAIARRAAEAQGGTVSYRPRAGGGSIFTLELPAADIAEP
jgi:two-component system sensor histidine kinase KdpD